MKDLSWLRPGGGEMSEDEWNDARVHTIGLWMSGSAADLTEDDEKPVVDHTLVILMNADEAACDFRLPTAGSAGRWTTLLDTALPNEPAGSRRYRGGGRYPLAGRSMAILAHPSRSRLAELRER